MDAVHRRSAVTAPRLTAIFSGADAGTERGAIDAALELGLKVGGWRTVGSPGDMAAPAYAEAAKETLSPRMAARLNVQDSDGTLVLSFSETIGSVAAYADEAAQHQRKALLHVVLPAGGRSTIPDELRAAIIAWIADERIRVLYVAGPSERTEPGIQTAVRDALVWIFEDEFARPVTLFRSIDRTSDVEALAGSRLAAPVTTTALEEVD